MVLLNKIKLLFSYVVYFIRARKSWNIPKKNKVLIYDGVNASVFLKYFPHKNPEILHVRGEQLNIWILFLSFFRRGKIKVAYEDCYIEHVCPKLIITFIDNNINFYSISQRHPSLKTLFIQNGQRGYYADIFDTLDNIKSKNLDKLAVDYMLTFGAVIGNHYAHYITGAVIPLGSLKNNILPRMNMMNTDKMVFISQWHKNGFNINQEFYSLERYTAQVDRPVIELLSKYAELKNKNLMIVPRTSKDSKFRKMEKLYFTKLLGSEVKFIEPEGHYSSYQAIDIAEVVVSIDSTLGYESIARGNKTAMFSIRGSLLGLKGLDFGWPGNFQDEGPFWTNNCNSDSFTRILDYLFTIGDMQWKNDLKKTDFSSLMVYNTDNSVLTDIIEREIYQTLH